MPIQPKQPTARGPADWFTGDVFLDAIARGEEPSRVRVSAVRFSPSARTAWHSHAVGQTLYVTEGRGLVQSRGAGVAEIRPGDIIYTPADEWHWHGAAPGHFMTHCPSPKPPRQASDRNRTGGSTLPTTNTAAADRAQCQPPTGWIFAGGDAAVPACAALVARLHPDPPDGDGLGAVRERGGRWQGRRGWRCRRGC